MDSEYLSSDDSDTISNTLSIYKSNIFDDLSENDICEITINIMSEIDSYMQTEIVTLSSPNFYSTMNDVIANTIFEDWMNYGLCEEDEEDDLYEEIIDLVEQLVEFYLEFTFILGVHST